MTEKLEPAPGRVLLSRVSGLRNTYHAWELVSRRKLVSRRDDNASWMVTCAINSGTPIPKLVGPEDIVFENIHTAQTVARLVGWILK